MGWKNGEAEAEMTANSCERARTFRAWLRVHGARTPPHDRDQTSEYQTVTNKQVPCVCLACVCFIYLANQGSVLVGNPFF